MLRARAEVRSPPSHGGRIGSVGTFIFVVMVASTSSGAAQTTAVLEGRVVGFEGAPITNAIVSLDGYSPRLTADGGLFRFEGVPLGRRTIRVEAFGYSSLESVVQVGRDLSLTLVLEMAPFQLDSLVVSPRSRSVNGRVRDTILDVSLPEAEVLTSEGDSTRTNRAGRFSVDGWEDVPLYVGIRAFGYLPLDTVVVPMEDTSYSFYLATDPILMRMIEIEMKRLDDRAGGLMSITRRPMNRVDLLRFRGASLLELLREKYRMRGASCLVVDERYIHPPMGRAILETTMAQEIERIEFLFGGELVRVYTRDFMRKMVGGGMKLKRPTYTGMADPPFCS